MAEYIEHEAFRKAFEVAPDEWVKGRTVMAILDSIPAAAVQPIAEGASHDGEQDVAPVVHGQWENITDGMVMLGDCSECKERQPVLGTNYCKNCGAKMDGE